MTIRRIATRIIYESVICSPKGELTDTPKYLLAVRRLLSSRSTRATSRGSQKIAPRSFLPGFFRAKEASPSRINMVDVSRLANQMREEVRSYTRSVPRPIRLVGVLAVEACSANDDNVAAAEMYSRVIQKTLSRDGIQYEMRRCTGGVEQLRDVKDIICEMNESPDVHGIMVISSKTGCPSHPKMSGCPGIYWKTWEDYLRKSVSPAKDVEGLCPEYNVSRRRRSYFCHCDGRMTSMRCSRDDDQIFSQGCPPLPCTAVAVCKILGAFHHHQLPPYLARGLNSNKPWRGMKATVINRSEIVGRPLAKLLALQGATVYSVDENSILCFTEDGIIHRCEDDELTLEDCMQQSTVVVTAVPSPDFVLPTEFISPEATVVDVSSSSNVDNDMISLLRPDVRLISNVGKVTCATLEQNLVRLHRQQSLDTF